MSAFASRYLVVTRLNSHKEPMTTAIGPFGSDAELLAFAQGVRYGNTTNTNAIRKATCPLDVTITNPTDLYPWMVDQIQEYKAKEGT